MSKSSNSPDLKTFCITINFIDFKVTVTTASNTMPSVIVWTRFGDCMLKTIMYVIADASIALKFSMVSEVSVCYNVVYAKQ